MFEKKRGTRFLASVMALVMLLSLAPVGALAADETPTNEECSAGPLPAEEGSMDTPKEDTPTPPWPPSPWRQTPWRAAPKQTFSRKGTCSTRLLA